MNKSFRVLVPDSNWTSLSLVILVFSFAFASSLAYAQNETNSTIPKNAIRTPNGGWITPLQTTDMNGNKLTIHYETGTGASGNVLPPSDSSPSIEISSMKTSPSIIKVGDTFTVSAKIESNSSRAIYLLQHNCSLFSAKFDSNVRFETNRACSYPDLVQLITSGATIGEPLPQGVYRATGAGLVNATVTFLYLPQNESGTNLVDIARPVSKPFQFRIYDNNTNVLMIHPPPLKQVQSGALPKDVQCDKLVLAFKREDGTPACVMPDNLATLVLRGWAKDPMSGLLDEGYSTQEQQDAFFYKIMNLAPLREWSQTGWRFIGGNYIGDEKYDVHFSQLGLFLPPNTGDPKAPCPNGWYASVAIDTRKLVILNESYPSVGDCDKMGGEQMMPPAPVLCDQACSKEQEARGMLCYQIDSDGNYYCIQRESNVTQVLIPPEIMPFGRHITPQEVRVQIGTNNTVQWFNAEDFPYQIRANNGQFQSVSIMPNQTWEHTFDKPGEYGYHYFGTGPGLPAKITVVPANNQTG